MKRCVPRARSLTRSAIGSLFVLAFTVTAAAQTAVPQLLPVTGAVAWPNGAPMSGPVGITFAIYDQAEGGTPLWTERQIVTADPSGRFAVWVGAFGQSLPTDLFQSGQARWMSVAADGMAEQPRAQFIAAGNAAVDWARAAGSPGLPFLPGGGDWASRPVAPTSDPNRAQSYAARRDPSEWASALDQVIPDDLIVQGSTCVGLDCVNGENFGFDTIRMKENNTRIQFTDTSTTTGYPNNNWQIRANGSEPNTGNYLAFVDQGNDGNSESGTISFRVDAGAPTNSLRVNSVGDVGIKTATPVLDLHMNTTDTPAVRFEQNNTGGFTAQTWDVGANEANFFVRDVTGGSRLSLRIRPGAPTSSLDIAANGNVGIGKANAGEKLDVDGDTRTTGSFIFGNGDIGLRKDGAGVVAYDSGASWATGYRLGTFADPNAFVITNDGKVGVRVAAPTHAIQAQSGAHLTVGGAWTNASSRTLKDHIEPLDARAAVRALGALRPVTYVYRADPADPQVGFIAEDVPDLVATPDRRSLASMDVVAVAVAVIQEQQKQLDALRQAGEARDAEVAGLRARLAELERLLAEVRRER